MKAFFVKIEIKFRGENYETLFFKIKYKIITKKEKRNFMLHGSLSDKIKFSYKGFLKEELDEELSFFHEKAKKYRLFK